MDIEMQKDFLATLDLLGGKVPNKSLRLALAWELEPYNRVRDELRAQGKVASYRCRGGGVVLVKSAFPAAETVEN